MQAAQLGAGGPMVSRLGFGAWAIGGSYDQGLGPVSDAVSVQTLLHAVDLGVGWIDTAPVYGHGHSESVIGVAFKQLSENNRPMIFTKCGLNWWERPEGTIASDLRPNSIRSECEQSLARLGVEVIDLYQIHRPDRETGTPVEESWATMADLVAEGKVRWIGVSNFNTELLGRCENIHHVDSLQPRLNLLERDSMSLIDWCRDHTTGVLAYSPMASGLLTGAFDRQRIDSLAEDDWRRRWPQFTEPGLSSNLHVVERLRTVAESVGCSLPELAVAWVLHQPGVTATIVGARTPRQVGGWAGAAGVVLSRIVLRSIDDALLSRS